MIVDNQVASQQFVEDPSPSEAPMWVKPTFEVIGVSLECTAYAGARDVEE